MRQRSRDADASATRLAEIIRALVEKRPELRAMTGPPAPIRVGALRNSTYRIDAEEGSFVLRVPPRRAMPFVDHRSRRAGERARDWT
jgi:hypothetical protein